MLATLLAVVGAIMLVAGVHLLVGVAVALVVAGMLLMAAAYGLHRAAAAAGGAQSVTVAPSLERVA